MRALYVSALFAVLLAPQVFGQANATPILTPNQQFVDCRAGSPCPPLAGGSLYSYAAGSSTPLATCASNAITGSSCSTPNANPVVINTAGYNSAGGGSAGIWQLPGRCYKFVLKDASAVTLWTIDNVCTSGAAISPPGGTFANNDFILGAGGTLIKDSGFTLVPNASLAHSVITVNGVTCTLGSTCAVSASASHSFGAAFGSTASGATPLVATQQAYTTIVSGFTATQCDIQTVPDDTASFQIWRLATGGTANPTVSNSLGTMSIASGGVLQNASPGGSFSSVIFATSDIIGISLSVVGGTATYASFSCHT